MLIKENILVSVIIPVYNIEAYIEKCVKSVMNQTYTNIEIILVDDGSTDASGIICDSLKTLDTRIHVIHKQNGGQTSARKEGIGIAKGEYVTFVDGDDWVDEELVMHLMETREIHGADIVTSGHVREDRGTSSVLWDSLPEKVYQNDEEKQFFYSHMIFNETVTRVGVCGYLWAKLFRITLVKEVIFGLSECIKYAEDTAMVHVCCLQADSIVITHKAYYHYVIRDGSITHSSNKFFLQELNEWYLWVRDKIENSKYSALLTKQLELSVINKFLVGVNTYMGFSKESTIPYYYFDEACFRQGVDIALYGAGNVGQCYYKQMLNNRKIQLAGWVDQNHEKYRKMGMNVTAVDSLQNMKYDFVLLAVKFEHMAAGIKKQLLEIGVDEEKIIWLEPEHILDKYIKL